MLSLTLALAAFIPQGTSKAPVVINEFIYDDQSGDDIEFVELYNRSGSAVSIGDWVLDAKDATTQNAAYTIPTGTMLAAGGFYTIGADAANPGKIDLVVGTTNLWENSTEALTLLDNNGRMVDTLVYYAASSGIWDPALAEGTGLNARHFASQTNGTMSFQRTKDGMDNDDSGRDFFLAPYTPGAPNYAVINLPYGENWEGATVGDPIGSAFNASWARGSVIDPTVVDTNNLNAIPANPAGGNKAMILWDSTGGGDTHYFVTAAAKDVRIECDIYIDGALTAAASGEGETWSIGIRGMDDAYGYHVDLSGAFPASSSEKRFGQSGIHVVYQRDETKSELYLIDFAAGGTGYTILGSIPIVAGQNDGWQHLSFGAQGNIAAMTWGKQSVIGNATSLSAGGITFGYRERFSTNSLARPLTIDNLLIEACDSSLYFEGHATASTTGTPMISATAGPSLNQMFTVTGSGMGASNASHLFIGASATTPLDLAAFGGVAGSLLYVQPIFLASSGVVDAQGEMSVSMMVPNDPIICGSQVAFQFVEVDNALSAALPWAHSEAMIAVVGN